MQYLPACMGSVHRLYMLTYYLRTVLWVVLNLRPEAVALMGPSCSSWGLPARATSMRNFMNALGARHLKFVHDSSVTISRMPGCSQRSSSDLRLHNMHVAKLRMVLVCYLLCARHCYFVVEHPFQSLLDRHPRWESFCNMVAWAA